MAQNMENICVWGVCVCVGGGCACNMENVDFRTLILLLLLHNNGLYWSKNWDLWVIWKISDQTHIMSLSKVAFFFEKMHKVVKNKTQGRCTSLPHKLWANYSLQ